MDLLMGRLVLTLVISLFYAPGTWANPQSFCSSEEEDLFTCSIGKKIVSICSSKDLSSTSGYVQYRFGKNALAPELVYPSEKRHTSRTFSYGSTGSAHYSLENLQFTLSGNSYTVYRESSSFGDNGSGIVVKTREGKPVRLRCAEASPPNKLYVLEKFGFRELPEEALVTLDSFGTWPADSPNVDLIQGVRTHDFPLVNWALKNGADVNFHGDYDSGVLGNLIYRRDLALRESRVAEFDDETVRLLNLLLAHGASPSITLKNGTTITVVDVLANNAPERTVLRFLDDGWAKDYDYRLYVGIILDNSGLVEEALDHGVDPNKAIRNSRYLTVALLKPCALANIGEEAEQRQALKVLEQLLKTGAKIVQGNQFEGGDITTTYALYGNQPNIQPVLELLIRYASPEDKKNSLDFLSHGDARQFPQRQANLEWLLKRLKE